MVKIGLIARADDSGLGIQTQLLHKLLKPSRTLVIDFQEQRGMPPHLDRFNGTVRTHRGFLDTESIEWITDDVDVVLTCEIDYAQGGVYNRAREKSVKTFVHYNFEFLENMRPEFPRPDVYLAPSTWNINRLPDYIKEKTIYLPLPVESNWTEQKDEKAFLHVAGKHTVEDRNGTRFAMEALQYIKDDIRLLITHQDVVRLIDDPRIIDMGYVPDLSPLYSQAARLVLPRRFGGQSLVIHEAVAHNCLPILLESDPYEIGRRVSSHKKTKIVVYTSIDVYSCDPRKLAKAMMAEITKEYRDQMKEWLKMRSPDVLIPQWQRVLSDQYE